jgi:hypothetical protein
VGFAKPTKSHDMVLVLLISMSWIQWHTSFWILIAFRVFHHFGAPWILRKMYWYENFRSHPSNFYQKYFLYVLPKQWPFYGTFIKLSVHYSLNLSTFRPWFGQNSTNFMQFNNYKPVSLLYSKGVPLYEVSGMFKGWRSCGDSKIVELAPWFLVSRGLIFTLFLLDCI